MSTIYAVIYAGHIHAAIHAARWPGPFGWLYRNTPGNLAASGITFVGGYVVGRIGLKNLHAKIDSHHAAIHDHLAAQDDHLAAQDDHLGAIHAVVVDSPPPPPSEPT